MKRAGRPFIAINTSLWVVGAVMMILCLASCSGAPNDSQASSASTQSTGADTSNYLVSVLDEPTTMDFQCTTTDYTIALNCFNRLVEMSKEEDGSVKVAPSLAESWEVSDDGLVYTFHLHKGVRFSNGSPLTASDVLYSFTRLLTHPDSSNSDIVHDIKGAKQLMEGEATKLEGFRILDDETFVIALEQPFSAFLACLCMPGASILDEQTMQEVGDGFGKDPASTIGTGSFVITEWNAGKGLILKANDTCWEGAPKLAGLDLRFTYHPEALSKMFDDGELDILNLDDLGDLSEFYLHGDAYRDNLRTAQHIGIDYIALNESVTPLNDVRVRKALQLALNRQTLLDATYGGAGLVENGIYPHGLLGFNPNLAPIPYDVQKAASLLAEAGYADGFNMVVSLRNTSTERQRNLMEMVASMWDKVGVRATIEVLSEEDFMQKRTSGQLACYAATWAADYDDPDNFVYTFFGSEANTKNRSLCYGNKEIIKRVRDARSIMDDEARIKEYDELERIIVQDDAAWIPLFSKERHYLVSERVENFTCSWNGWFETSYKYMSIRNASE